MDNETPLWVLLGGRTGDNNQLLRVAEALRLPFRTIELRYNRLHLIPPRILGATLSTLHTESKWEIGPPWPELVLGIGYRSVPVALAIRKFSGGKTKLVRLGNPRLDPGNFDLVITTPQYAVPDAPNVIRLPVGIPAAAPVEPNGEEDEWLKRFPRPHRLLLIGGDTFMWTLSAKSVAQATRDLAAKGGSVIPVGSPRSSPKLIAAAGPRLDSAPRYPVLLADADEIYVTGDSVSMISDAIATGKPVGIVRPDKTPTGRLLYGFAGVAGRSVPVRDIQRFTTSILDQGLAGTVEQPRAASSRPDALESATGAIRNLLGIEA
jgi:mitochondrial fission protein ELM1